VLRACRTQCHAGGALHAVTWRRRSTETKTVKQVCVPRRHARTERRLSSRQALFGSTGCNAVSVRVYPFLSTCIKHNAHDGSPENIHIQQCTPKGSMKLHLFENLLIRVPKGCKTIVTPHLSHRHADQRTTTASKS
jgi:hypothetical protein